MSPTNYQGNSNKDKENRPKKEEATVERPKLDPVVSGGIIHKKPSVGKRLKSTFFGGDAKEAGRYVLASVLLPAARNMIADAGTNLIDRMIYGESRGRRGSNEMRSIVSYNSMSRPLSRDRDYVNLPDQPRRAIPRPISGLRREIEDVVIINRVDAELVVEQMIDITSQYGVASVGDYCDLLGVTAMSTDQRWGWTDLREARVRQVREGYMIELPSPQPIPQ